MFGGDFLGGMSPLQRLIAQAVDPYKTEPDFAAHLEVAEYINTKKANTYVAHLFACKHLILSTDLINT